MDRNRTFLNVAKTSYTLNGFPIDKQDFLAEDFFPAASRFKRSGQTFDCVFLDPPFFASTSKGTVDLETGSTKLINKIRPLINDGGWLVAINNALFVSGKDYLASLEALCADGYLSLEELIPVPADCTGFPQTRLGNPPVDPAPFNHSTKIAILRVRRKPQCRISVIRKSKGFIYSIRRIICQQNWLIFSKFSKRSLSWDLVWQLRVLPSQLSVSHWSAHWLLQWQPSPFLSSSFAR